MGSQFDSDVCAHDPAHRREGSAGVGSSAEREVVIDRICGALIGQAYGDAFGMPSELWNRAHVAATFGWIDAFLPGHPENVASNEFVAYQFTDDTSQALALAKVITQEGAGFCARSVGLAILEWAQAIGAFEKNILGPSSKAALSAIASGADIEALENQGITNGAAMRISPVGCAFSFCLPLQLVEADVSPGGADVPLAGVDVSLAWPDAREGGTDVVPGEQAGAPAGLEVITSAVWRACAPTHKSYSALTGARLVACAISALINGARPSEVLECLPRYLERYPYARQADDFTPSYAARIEMMCGYFAHEMRALRRANPGLVPFAESTLSGGSLHENVSSEEYALIARIADGAGAGMSTAETVSCAFFLNAACGFDPVKVAFLAANLGGDTDTIGAIACAIAGAARGSEAFPAREVHQLEETNNVHFAELAAALYRVRDRGCGAANLQED